MVKPLQIHPHAQEIYLDCNATTPVLPQIAEAVKHVMERVFGNPSSSHITGLQARYILDNTRRLGREVIGASDGRFIFTSGATEGIQTAVLSALRAASETAKQTRHAKRWLLYGATEHKAVPQALQHWQSILGLAGELKAIPVDRHGRLDTDFIAAHVGDAYMICTMAVNNETGVQQDLKQLEQVIREYAPAVPWLVDCVQALGKQALALGQTTIDYVPFSGHKLYAPKGIGFLYVREGSAFTPLIMGGGQEQGCRAGTENLPGIAALNALFELLLTPEQGPFKSAHELHGYRTQLLNALRTVFPTLELNHTLENTVPTTLNFSVRGVPSRDIMDVFDAASIRVSSGSACSSGVTRSYVLDAMGVTDWQSQSAVRLSFGPATEQATIDLACERIRSAAKALQRSCLLLADTQEDIDSQLDGLVQWRYDIACCHLIIDREARELAIIDPVPQLTERIERLVACQHYRVKAVVTTQASTAVTMLAELLCASGCDAQRDDYGWPAQQESINVGRRLLKRVSSNQPVYSLSGANNSSKIDFVFVDSTNEREQLQSMLTNQTILPTTLICRRVDDDYKLVQSAREITQSNHKPGCDLVNIGPDQQATWLRRPETLVIDVREQQEFSVSPLQLPAEVVNVPLTRLVQFIHEQQKQNKQRPIVCLCRSGHRSALAAQVLIRNGFCNVSHLSGGLSLLAAV